MAVGEGGLPDFKPVKGIKIGVASAGIKTEGRDDLVIFELPEGASCAGVFTQNAFCAAPVHICKENLSRSAQASSSESTSTRYLLINTGNANAGTGQQGMLDARQCCQAVSELTQTSDASILPFSTGVIGERLPADRIVSTLPVALSSLSENNWAEAAVGIMTTDTRPKGAMREVIYAGRSVLINGISKGAGMIKPNMATMLAFVGTDANISQGLCHALVAEIAEQSFNRITVDGDTSTNDACMLFASAQSDAPEIDPEHPDYPVFKQALSDVFIELAHAIIRDGEGATKFVSVRVEQANDVAEALDVAYTLAHSPLIKTALFASDPNWGRILAALGRVALPEFDLSKVAIYLSDVRIVHAGEKCSTYTEAAGQIVMNREEITIRVVLGRGQTSETVWTTDLSHDYVTINAEYRT